jgi:hypothetical protein
MNTSRRNFMSAIFGTGIILPTTSSLFNFNVLDHLRFTWRSLETKEMLCALPMRNPNVTVRQEGNYEILTDTSNKADVLKINAMASDIWNLCDGKKTAGDIVRKIVNNFDVDPDQCMRDVIITLLAFKRKELVII